jgi:hypothetical protein
MGASRGRWAQGFNNGVCDPGGAAAGANPFEAVAVAALGQGAILLQFPEQLGQQAGGALPLLGAAAAALGAEEGWPQQAPLGLGEVVGELGA